jgi:hypothetical protein
MILKESQYKDVLQSKLKTYKSKVGEKKKIKASGK